MGFYREAGVRCDICGITLSFGGWAKTIKVWNAMFFRGWTEANGYTYCPDCTREAAEHEMEKHVDA
jgi:hypothetical protein